MTVFKGFLIITRRNIQMMVLYLLIFLSIAVAAQKMRGENTAGFEQVSLNIGVIDQDGGELAEGLADYLAQYHTITGLPDDPSVVQDRIFYRDVYYVVTIPKNFEERCLLDGETLQVTKVPGSNSGFYVDQQINTFMNKARIMTKSGFALTEAISEIMESSADEAEVNLIDKNGFGGDQPDHAFMFQYMPYILISILCYSMSYIMIAFRNRDVRMRMMCSALSLRSQNFQLTLGFAAVGTVIYCICALMPLLMYRGTFIKDPNMPYYLLNSFLMTLVSLSLSFLIGTLVSSADVVSAVVNVVSLGMSFLCGVFVDLELLGKGVRTFAQFLPVYWYETANGLLAHNSSFSHTQQTSLGICYGLQLLFAAAILGVAMVISRIRQTS